jgi:hypothetical protein
VLLFYQVIFRDAGRDISATSEVSYFCGVYELIILYTNNHVSESILVWDIA